MPRHASASRRKIMSKSEIMTTDTGTAGEAAALPDKDLDAVTGGAVTGGATPQLFEFCATGRHVKSGRDGWIDVLSYSWGPTT
jgi:hypothetical protein